LACYGVNLSGEKEQAVQNIHRNISKPVISRVTQCTDRSVSAKPTVFSAVELRYLCLHEDKANTNTAKFFPIEKNMELTYESVRHFTENAVSCFTFQQYEVLKLIR
jgi:hypothetical protein